MSIAQPPTEVRPKLEQEKKPVEQKQPIKQRFQAARDKAKATVAHLGKAIETVIFDAKSIDFTNEQSQAVALVDQLDALNTETEAQLGITQEKPEEVRQELPEKPFQKKETPFEKPIPGFAEKEEIVKQFIAEKGIREGGLFHDQSKNAEYFQKQIEKQNQKRRIVDKVKRAYLVNRVGANGIKNAEQAISVFEQAVAIPRYEDLSGRNIAELIKHLDPQDEQAALAKLSQGLQRLQQLNLFPHLSEFKSPKFAEAISTLVDIPDETFQQTIKELDSYKFLYCNSYVSSPNTGVLIEIFKHGGFTEEQRSLLKQEKLYSDLTGNIPIVKQGENNWRFNFMPNLSEALNPKEDYLNEFYPYLIDYASIRIDSPARYSKAGEIDRGFIDGLDALREKGKLPNLRNLVENDWDCTQIYEGIEKGAGAPTIEQTVELMGKISDFSKDTDKVIWVKQFQEAVEGNPRLIAARVDAYEAMYQERKSLEEFNAVLQALSNSTEIKLADILSVSDGVLTIEYKILGEKLKEFKNNAENPSDEQYASLVRTVLYTMPENKNLSIYASLTLKKEYVPLFAFIATQKDQLGELTENGDPKAALVEQVLASGITPDPKLLESFVRLCTDPENLSPNLAWQHISSFKSGNISAILSNLPDSFIDTLPLDDRNIIGVAKDLPVYAEVFLIVRRAEFVALIKDGKPTADFLNFLGSKYEYMLNPFLTDDVISSFAPDEKQFWQTFKDSPNDTRDFLFSNKDKYQEFFVDGKPSRTCIDAVIKQKKFQVLWQFLTEEVLSQYSDEERSVFATCKELPSSLQERLLGESAFPDLDLTIADRYRIAADLMSFASMDSMDNNLINFVRNADNYQDLLINGRPSKVFIDAVIRNKDFQTLPKFLTEDVLSQYNSAEKSVFATWMILPDDLKQEVIKEAPDFPNIPADQAEKYRVAAETITRIRNSPSVEIKRLEKELIGQLWKLDNPTQALEEIIGVFEKNNLPLVGKVYRVFETIYDNPNATGTTTLEQDLSNKTNLSPVLKVATPRERREIIYKDLLSINVASGNPQLRDYLEVLRDGEQVVSKMDQEGVGALNDREQNQLGHFFDKMDMLYSTSLFGRTIENRRRVKHIDSSPTTSHLSLEERRDALRKNFRVRSDQKLTDRLSEMFLKPLGFTKIEDVLEKMDHSNAEADLRNREFVKANDGKIVLKPGDRFKGVSYADIGKILERGAVAREYLGASAGSDSTPYDTDTGLILEQDLANGVTSAVGASPSNGYGDILLVVKDRKQFGTGDNQYESFASGVVGERHYGIRTGFASTEIDAILAKDSSFDARKLDDLFMAIAQQGEYIPVGDMNGNIIFTPQQFDEYRKTFDGVSEYSSNPVTVKRVGVDEATYAFPNSPQVVASTRGVLNQLMEEVIIDRGNVIDLSSEIRKRLSHTLAANGVALRGEFDSSIYGAELVDTGSTARGSNVPGDYDFDMSLQLDPNDSKRLAEIANVVKSTLKLQEDASHTETDYVQVRGMGSQIIEGQTLDIDIGIGMRSDEGIFASSDAVAQKLDSIRTTFGDETYHDVLANIVLAKKILKEGHAYKKLEDGGLGGIGVENWILLHNGNVLDAFTSFWQAAHDEQGVILPYEEFTNKYNIFDAGYNIKFNRHDNFTRVLKPAGYQAMVQVAGKYLNLVPQDIHETVAA